MDATLAALLAALEAMRGARAAPLRALRREYSRRLAAASPSAVVRLAQRLLDAGGIERRVVAYELVHHHRGALGSLRAASLVRLGRGLDGWGAVDMFACYLAGPAWRERQVSDALVRRWARSRDRWWRRAALVSTVPLNTRARGGSGDTPRTLAVCRMLIADRDDMVVKAMSWALREVAKRDPAGARRFVAAHRKDLAARVVREVGNKLATGLKNPRGRRRP
ncbi:MAG TPA: DNA alkylation repair protein [Gemmatimonadales bacterium]|nr:DNA alkylation repair protein [Gemmatimonadales bacterium]